MDSGLPDDRRNHVAGVRIGIRLALVALFLIVQLQRDSGGQDAAMARPTAQQTAAKEYFRSGVRGLQSGDLDQAVAELKKAVTLRPDAADFHAALSEAFLAKKEQRQAWNEARIAFRLEKSNQRIAEQLVVVWSALDLDDQFTVGTSSDAIRKLIGEPDRINRAGDSARWVYGCMAIDMTKNTLFSTIDLRGYRPELQQSPIRIGFVPEPRQWRASHRHIDRFAATTEYNAIEDDGAIIVTQRIYNTAAKRTPRRWMEDVRRRSAPRDSSLDWEVLAEDKFGIVYRWSLPGEKQRKPHWELTRILEGERDLHRISFITNYLPRASQIETWQQKLLGIHLIRPKRSDPPAP